MKGERWGRVGLGLLETVLIFGVFAAYGAWPIPDVNEQYYVGKAIHFWNPEVLRNDPFLNTPDSHWLFYAVFGLLSLVFSQTTTAIVGRCLAWALTAAAWRRLSRALIPRDGFALLTATCFAFFIESFHLAGEWVVGGVEGKSFSFPLVFWGLAFFLEGKFNRAWLALGAGSAFHPLVGGWATLAALIAQTVDAYPLRARFGAYRREVVRGLPGLFAGGAISLLGVIPALQLDAGASAAVVAASRKIYVFRRLSHHLAASSLPWTHQTRFALLALALFISFAALALIVRNLRLRGVERAPDEESRLRFRRLAAFAACSLLFAFVGATLDYGAKFLAESGRLADRESVAGLLRYYWFRLSDWTIPATLAFVLARAIDVLLRARAADASGSRSETESVVGRRLLFGSTFVASLLACYWYFRSVFYHLGEPIAASGAVDGAIPMAKPSECVAFLATFDAFGLALVAALAFDGWRLKRRGSERASHRSAALRVCMTLWVALFAVAAPGWRLASFADLRGTKVPPRSEPPKESISEGWRDVCRWARAETDLDAIFLVPRGCDSFKWFAGRAEAGSWKEIPQDATSIVKWYDKMRLFYENPGAPEGSAQRWNQALCVVFIVKGRARILAESAVAGYDYAILEAPPYNVFLDKEALRRWNEFAENDVVYQNQQFVVLKFKK